VHPIAFQLGSFTIYWYGILTALGFFVAFLSASRRSVAAGLPPQAVADLAPWLIVGAIVGARALFVISYWKEYFADKPLWEIFMLSRSGLVYYGGLVGSCLATIIYCQIRKLPLWKVADTLAPSIALGHGFGRVGCLMTGCCYGRPTSLPWAIHFPHTHETAGAGVHPTQIYESTLNILLFLSLAWLFKRRKFDGQIFATYLVAYAVLRTFVEMFRGDYPKYYLGGIVTPAQLVSAAILIIGVALFWRLSQTGTPLNVPLEKPRS
jgi:phosphatidylglycerol---prolipoprotein diacylglyceryl transferase